MKRIWLNLIQSLMISVYFSQSYAAGPEEGEKFEGDIILNIEQERASKNGLLEKRSTKSSSQWPNNVVPYVYHSSISASAYAVRVIKGAMEEWSKHTCIVFKPRSNETGYIEFYKGDGCSSYVGYQGNKQEINLASYCWRHGTVLHEIGHALGFWHEHTRADRDKYITIVWQNILPGYSYIFNKKSYSKSLGEPYDFGSVMHYHKLAFSKNYRQTILTKPPDILIGQRVGLSNGDVKQMNLLYNCDSGCQCLKCPFGWIPYDCHCYNFSSVTSASWNTARKSCVDEGADLLCLSGYTEWEFVRDQLAKMNHAFGSANYWIGPNIVSKGTWKCAGNSMTYFRWSYGQPDNATGNQECVEMYHTGFWNDLSCSSNYRRYICKKMA